MGPNVQGNQDDSYSAPSSPEIRASYHQYQQHHQRSSFFQPTYTPNNIINDNQDPMLISSISSSRHFGKINPQTPTATLSKRSLAHDNAELNQSMAADTLNVTISRRRQQLNNKMMSVGRHQSLDERHVAVATERLSSLDGDADEEDDDPLSDLPLPPPPLRGDENDYLDDEYEISSRTTDLEVSDDRRAQEVATVGPKQQQQQQQENSQRHRASTSQAQDNSNKNFRKQQLTLNDLGDQLSLIAQLQQLDKAQSSDVDANQMLNVDSSIGFNQLSRGENLHDFFSLPLIVQLSALLAKNIQTGDNKLQQSNSNVTSETESPPSIPIDDLLNLLNISGRSASAKPQTIQLGSSARPQSISYESTSDSRGESMKHSSTNQQSKLQNLQFLISTLQKLDLNQQLTQHEVDKTSNRALGENNNVDLDNANDSSAVVQHQNHFMEDVSPTTSNDGTIISKKDDTIIENVPQSINQQNTKSSQHDNGSQIANKNETT